jgi:hypothetical protein
MPRALDDALAPVPFLTYPEAKGFIQHRVRAQCCSATVDFRGGASISFIYSGPTSAGRDSSRASFGNRCAGMRDAPKESSHGGF